MLIKKSGCAWHDCKIKKAGSGLKKRLSQDGNLVTVEATFVDQKISRCTKKIMPYHYRRCRPYCHSRSRCVYNVPIHWSQGIL